MYISEIAVIYQLINQYISLMFLVGFIKNDSADTIIYLSLLQVYYYTNLDIYKYIVHGFPTKRLTIT